MVGFVPEKESEEFSETIRKISGVSVDIRPPDSDSNLQIPVKLKNNRFTNPFSLFVEMYGLPAAVVKNCICHGNKVTCVYYTVIVCVTIT